MEVGQHDVVAHIQVALLKLHNPLLSVFPPANSTAFVVELIGRGIDIAKIAQSVIKRIAVDVVDNVRLLVVSKEPRNSVGQEALPVEQDDSVASATFGGSSLGSGNAVASTNFIEYLSSFSVVTEVIMDGIRNNFRSHVVPPYDVVRGLGIAVPSTPILSQEFASSGGNSRGTNWISPCSTITDTPFKERR
jgi:hypothetical protein